MPNVLQKVDRLTQRFNEEKPLTEAERKQLYAAFSRRILAQMADKGLSWGKATGLGALYTSNDGDGRKQLLSHDQDLGWQCDTVDTFLSHHLRTGDIVPPHFPQRIAILLRKSGERRRERAFLEGWCHHFGTMGWFGARLHKLK